MAPRNYDLASAAAILALVDSNGRLAVRATPNARANAVTVTLAAGTPFVSVRTTASPQDGDANEAVLKLLAKALKCPRSSVAIVRGRSSRHKVVRIKQS